MRLMLTSCGLETEKIKGYFLEMLGKDPCRAKALLSRPPRLTRMLSKCCRNACMTC